jgi:hypothetical protein
MDHTFTHSGSSPDQRFISQSKIAPSSPNRRLIFQSKIVLSFPNRQLLIEDRHVVSQSKSKIALSSPDRRSPCHLQISSKPCHPERALISTSSSRAKSRDLLFARTATCPQHCKLIPAATAAGCPILHSPTVKGGIPRSSMPSRTKHRRSQNPRREFRQKKSRRHSRK